MKNTTSVLFLVIISLSVLIVGCAAPGKPKGVHQVVGEGLANTSLIIYDAGAMTVNTTWGIVSFGYGFGDGQTLLPLYNPGNGKFEPQIF